VATITLNRPEVRNALNTALLIGLLEALEAAEADPDVRCVVLTGTGAAFCAGADLNDFRARLEGDRPAVFGEHFTPVVSALRRIEKPVIAALNGPAVGAGASFALACDLRVAADSASISVAYVRVGLIPDTGGTLILPLLTGLGKAAELAFTGGRVGAEEALRLGLVNRVVPAGELMQRATEWAHELAALPTRAIGLTKRGFNAALMPDFDQLLQDELLLIREAFATDDHREGVLAFLERREPRFIGR
jgi:2-(1,2-epoxy-1,2-dihydrophenyl)acetyl-CoA isomerase